MTRDTFVFRSPDRTPAQTIDTFRQFYGPTMNAFDAAEKNGQADELYRQLVALAQEKSESQTGTLIPATLLRVVVAV